MKRNKTKTETASPLRRPLSAKTAVLIVSGLLFCVGVVALSSRALSRASNLPATPHEMPRQVREQVTGEFDPKAVARPAADETTQEGALRRERLEAIRNQPASTASQMP